MPVNDLNSCKCPCYNSTQGLLVTRIDQGSVICPFDANVIHLQRSIIRVRHACTYVRLSYRHQRSNYCLKHFVINIGISEIFFTFGDVILSISNISFDNGTQWMSKIWIKFGYSVEKFNVDESNLSWEKNSFKILLIIYKFSNVITTFHLAICKV